MRTAGIIDLTTKGGLLQPGGSVSVYGGSHSTFEPSAWYGGSSGAFSYFVSADVLRTDLGIESPDASTDPLHDHSTQAHGFGYFEDILNDNNRLSLDARDLQRAVPDSESARTAAGRDRRRHGARALRQRCLVLCSAVPGNRHTSAAGSGRYAFLSNDLEENQHELAQYAILSWQYSQERFHLESSVSARYTSLDFEPDWTGDLLYNGIAQNAFKSDVARRLADRRGSTI